MQHKHYNIVTKRGKYIELSAGWGGNQIVTKPLKLEMTESNFVIGRQITALIGFRTEHFCCIIYVGLIHS